MPSFIQWVRPNILALKPYTSARDEFHGSAQTFLDANENPFLHEYNMNRYPDPMARDVKAALSKIKNIPVENIFFGNGSDEAIDLLLRIFCKPELDNIIIMPPTYGMYAVSAGVNNVKVIAVPLDDGFQPRVEAVLEAVTPQTKMLFVCSPNNPTGNAFLPEKINALIEKFEGIVVIDEAYCDFSTQPSLAQIWQKNDKVVVMQTLSKAWGLAGIRTGMAYAHADLIALMNKIKPPYNVNILSQRAALKALNAPEKTQKQVKALLNQRELLIKKLKTIPQVTKIYPTDANFIFIECTHAQNMYKHLTEQGVVIRSRTSDPRTPNGLRISVGTVKENRDLIAAMRSFGM